jgi:hypothetical protein
MNSRHRQKVEHGFGAYESSPVENIVAMYDTALRYRS